MASEILFFALFGMVFGSFGNVLIARVPRGESIVKPGSRCPSCKTPIKPYHNIPILSWLMLRGKCAACGETIAPRYPLVEAAGGLIFAAVYLKAGMTLFAFLAALAFLLLMVLAVIDLEHKAVPDSINLPALLLALGSTPFFLANLEAAVFMAGALALLRFFVSWIFQKEAMGEADIIVAATMGALLGIGQTLLAVFLASLISLPFALAARIKGRDPEIPFIPFLALGAFLTYCLGGYFPLFGALQ